MVYLKVFRRSLFLLMALSNLAHASGVDLGLGLGFVDASHREGFEGGWDVQAGYEFTRVGFWDIGAQFEAVRGWTSSSRVDNEGDMSFSSNGLYVTARPKDWWIYLKGGIVTADYRIASAGPTAGTDRSEVGVGMGAGLALPYSDNFRLHVLDYQRMTFGADSFDVVTLSLAILFGH